MATTIVLVRHGVTDWNRDRRFQGHADVPLNDEGRAQARELAEKLAGESFAVAYSSPLLRASETAEILAERLDVQVRPIDALKEVDVGSWSGLTVAEVEKRYPEGYARWIEWRASGWEDGETYEELSRRVVAGLRELADSDGGGSVLAVTHGGPIRAALAAASGRPLDEISAELGVLGNCGVVRIAVRDGNLQEVR